MKTKNLKYLAPLMAAVGLMAGQQDAKAVAITVDQILANPVSGTLSGTVDMTLSGSTLTITLVNTSTSTDVGANVLLTGIAFDMPNGLNITSGGVVVATGSTIVGGSANGSGGGTSVSQEWGYANGVSGHFNGLAVDTQVSTMDADSTTKFAAGHIDNPDVLNGPEFGLVATGGNTGGQTAIRNSIVITLNLSGSVPGNLLTIINNGIVALTFGSPNGGTTVPDSGATVGLLGLAMLGIAGLRRKLAKTA